MADYINKDYISKEDAIEALKFERWGINLVLESETLPYETRQMLYQRRGQVSSDINTIKHLPAADVVEQKRGKWIKILDVSRFSPGKAEYRCSVCLANEEHAESADVPYCWHCGANMREAK